MSDDEDTVHVNINMTTRYNWGGLEPPYVLHIRIILGVFSIFVTPVTIIIMDSVLNVSVALNADFRGASPLSAGAHTEMWNAVN